MRARGTARADRFALLRDVYPTLFGPAPSVVHASIFSHRVAGSASVANAFAAELTAPVACLQDLIGGRGSISQDDILEMAIELEATAGSVRHQVENHGLARIEPDVA